MATRSGSAGLPAGLFKFDALPPAEAVVQAFTNRGNHPAYHDSRIAMLRREMPLLHRALTRLAAEHRKETK